MTSEAPRSPNADRWALWISEFQPGTEYIAVQIAEAMEAHAQAMVAAEREACAQVAKDIADQFVGYMARIERAIRARTNDDAQAALDALLKAERVKALREASEAIADYPRIAPEEHEWVHYDEQIEYSQRCILALIEKETGQ